MALLDLFFHEYRIILKEKLVLRSFIHHVGNSVPYTDERIIIQESTEMTNSFLLSLFVRHHAQSWAFRVLMFEREEEHTGHHSPLECPSGSLGKVQWEPTPRLPGDPVSL